MRRLLGEALCRKGLLLPPHLGVAGGRGKFEWRDQKRQLGPELRGINRVDQAVTAARGGAVGRRRQSCPESTPALGQKPSLDVLVPQLSLQNTRLRPCSVITVNLFPSQKYPGHPSQPLCSFKAPELEDKAATGSSGLGLSAGCRAKFQRGFCTTKSNTTINSIIFRGKRGAD